MSWQPVNSIITVFKALWSTINEIANFCWSEITLLGLSRRASLTLWLIYWNEVFFFLLNCLPSTHFITTYMRCFCILAFCLAMLKVVRLCLFCANGLLSLDSVILEIYSCVAFWSLSLSLSKMFLQLLWYDFDFSFMLAFSESLLQLFTVNFRRLNSSQPL